MKFTKAIFRNFKGFRLGLKIKELTIDFTKCTHRICLILGGNGSGKTTLEEALTLFPDIYSSVRDANDFIDIDKDGKKDGYREIQFINENDKYISKVYWTTNQTKCFLTYITKDGNEEELNKNGNVRSYEELLETKFGLTKDLNKLLFLGPGMEDIISLTPSERKNNISKFIQNVEVYLNLYKESSGYYSKLKNDISIITNELHRLGDDKNKIETTRDSLNKKMIALQENLTYLNNVKNNSIKAINALNIDGKSVLDIYNNNININNSLCTSLNTLNIQFKTYCAKYNIKTSLSKNIYENNYQEIRDEYTKAIYQKESFIKQLNEFRNIKYNAESTLKSQESYYNSYIKDNNPEKFLKEQEDLHNEIVNIETNIESIKKDIPELDLNTILFTEEDATKYLMFIDSVMNRANSISLVYSEMDILQSYLRDDLSLLNSEDEYTNIKNKIEILNNKILQTTSNIQVYEQNKELSQMFKNIPANCHNKDCPFIRKAKDYFSVENNDMNKQLKEFITEKNILTDKLNNLSDYLLKSNNFLKDIKQFSDYINNYNELISKFPDVNIISNINEIFKHLQLILPRARKYSEFASLNKRYIELTSRLLEIKDAINKSNDYYNNLKFLESKINESKESIEKINSSIQQLCNNDAQIESSILLLNNKLQDYKIIVDSREKIISYLKQQNYIKKELKKMKKYYIYSKFFEDKLQLLTNKISIVNLDLQGATNEYNTSEYNLRRFVDFENQKENLLNEYEFLDTLRKCWSPTTGIPLIFIEGFMNTLLNDANLYLTRLWPENDFLIKGFNIDEKNFFILINRNGEYEIKDASQASGAERAMLCTVLSLALLKQNPNKAVFNIVKFDEIDSTLDYEKRRIFLDIIDELLDNINNEQTFMISHSDAFQGAADVILLKNSGEYKDRLLNGDYNVIYEY